jgi:thioesterase domain-containing protein
MTEADILKLLRGKVTKTASRSLDTLHFDEFGEILRYFGQYHSGERLLPKYGYASPGALYATQMYVEVSKIGDLKPGHYYYHPVDHQLILIRETDGSPTANLKIHFIGKRRAIEPVYKNNIKEVLEIEAGHMVGLFDNVLPRYGLAITALEYAPATKERLDCADEDYYLGTFEIIPNTVQQSGAPLDIYLQIHPRKGVDLPAGQYHYREGALTKISDELVLKRHVIAINQQIYDRSSFGITVISRAEKDWIRYIDLGRKLQEFQMNDINLGFMSSGYSSRTGNDLPSARRIDSILMSCGHETGPSYFFVGGRVTDAQVRSHGMKEDVVHMKGPAEMIRDDLRHFLPDYMIPNRVTVLDGLPLTVNGKIDVKTLEGLCETSIQPVDRPFVAPRTSTEKRIHAIWTKAMKRDAISVHEDFFECGGNSLLAVAIINKTNRAFQSSVPLQVLFECPTIEKLALKVDGEGAAGSSRLVPLQTQGSKNPVYCWPGLGGYPMNWRLLAGQMDIDRPFYGVQAYGINRGEEPYPTIKEMAAGDVKAIRRLQPLGPYTLWGYSFGARVAFETAYQLEQSGERVEHLFLIAPGSPKTRAEEKPPDINEPTYANEAYVTILFSVFAGSITHPLLKECLGVARDDESFASFICRRFKDLDPDLVKRIIGIVSRTYQFKYTFQELAGRQISAPVTIFKVRGDDYSFIEHSGGYSSRPPIVLNLDADHYGILKEPGIHELTHMIRYRLRAQVLEDNDARARGAGGAREPTSEGRPPCHTS